MDEDYLFTAIDELYVAMEPLPDEGMHEDLLEVPGATRDLPDGLRKPSGLCTPVATPALNPGTPATQQLWLHKQPYKLASM